AILRANEGRFVPRGRPRWPVLAPYHVPEGSRDASLPWVNAVDIAARGRPSSRSRRCRGPSRAIIVRTVHGDDERDRTRRQGLRARQSRAAPPAIPGRGTEKRG